MSLKNDKYPSSAAFDELAEALKKDDAGRKEAVKKAKAIFAFKLKNASGEEQSWYIDMKESGTVGTGAAPAGKKADVTLSLSDENFGKLVAGKSKAQSLFMSGKLKVAGNVMKATALEPILAKAGAQSKAKL